MCTCKVCCYIQWTNESHNCHGGSPLRVRFFFFFPIMHLVKRLIRKRTAAVPPNHKIKNKYKLQFLIWNLKQLKNNLFWWKCIRNKTEPIPLLILCEAFWGMTVSITLSVHRYLKKNTGLKILGKTPVCQTTLLNLFYFF